MQLKFVKKRIFIGKILNYNAFHILQRPFLLLEDSVYLQNAFNL